MIADQKYWNPVLETLPPDRLRDLQLKKFKRIFQWAYDHSKFHRNLYQKAGLGPGDEVLVTDFSFVATASPILRIGAKPVFVDINENYNMNLTSAKLMISSKTKAIIFVHLYGQMGNPKEIEEIGLEFDNPKPTRLVKGILSIFSKSDSLILDSFSGSGTTAHSVLALNNEDNGNRRFILVQCDELNKKTGKIENICDKITGERVRRVIKGVPKAKDENLKKGFGWFIMVMGIYIAFKELFLV